MDLKYGQLLNILLKPGNWERGYLIEWTEENCQIRSEETGNTILIQQPAFNIVAVEFIPSSADNQRSSMDEEIVPEPELNKNELRKKTLVELYKEKNKIEKEQVKKKIFSLDNTGVQNVEYGYPAKIDVPEFVKKK